MTKKTPVEKTDKKKSKPAQDAGFFMDDKKTVKPYKVRDAHINKGGSYTLIDGKPILNKPSGV